MERDEDGSALEEDRPEELEKMAGDEAEEERPPEHPEDEPRGPGVGDAFRSGG